MGYTTGVVDALGSATYYTWSADAVSTVKDALGRQTVLAGWDVEIDPTGYSAYFLYDGNREQTYAGDGGGQKAGETGFSAFSRKGLAAECV